MENFQEKLDALENGESIEDILEDLDSNEAELLRLAAELRKFNPPDRKDEAVMTQLATLSKIAEESQNATADPILGPRDAPISDSQIQHRNEYGTRRNSRPPTGWVVALAACMVALVALVVFVSATTLGLWWMGAARAQSATLTDISGEVLIAPAGSTAEWQPAVNGGRLRSGQRLRVGPGAAASLVFYEGSQVILDAGSQVTLDQLRGNWLKTLKVVLVQEAGTTRHSVVPLRGSRSVYQVVTPSGTASVLGTSFSVAVDEGSYARFSVDSGEVLVQRDTNEVTLTAGQAAVAQTGALKLDAAYQFTLIGPLTSMDADGWSVNGVTFTVTPDTRITGEPMVGLQVFVEGRILDGERIADRIVVLTEGQSESSFTGILESMDDQTLRVGGIDVLITPETVFTGDLQEEEPVKVIFVVREDGKWVALEIIALGEPPEEPTPTPTATDTATPTPTTTLTPTTTITPTVTMTPTVTTTPPVSKGPIVITDNDQVLTINCDGAEVKVYGNSNTLTLLGTCSSLTVRGNNNHITLESYTMVKDTGNENTITMPEAPPAAPQATPTAPQPMPPVNSGPIVITDNDQVLTINCDGAAVTVNGNNNTLTLLGTCSRLTVRGNTNLITLQSPTVVTDTGNENIIK